MKYKAIDVKTKEETICDKVTIGQFDFYVSMEYKNKLIPNKQYYTTIGDPVRVGRYRESLKSTNVIVCTNSPYEDIPKVVDEVEKLAIENTSAWEYYGIARSGFISGYNKSQETHPFSEEDMIEFAKWVSDNDWVYLPSKKYWVNEEQEELELKISSKEIFQLWKEQKLTTVYYDK